MPSPVRSLADDVRGRSDADLVALVLARPDLARPAPTDLTALAARASTRASVQRAVENLDTGHLRVLQALVVAGDGTEVSGVARLLGVPATAVRAHVEDLWTRALVWHGPGGWHLTRAVPEILGPSVAGLGPRWVELAPGTAAPSPEAVLAGVAEAPAAARTVLDTLTWGPSQAQSPTSPGARAAVDWLVAHEILLPAPPDLVALPREIGLVLRGNRLFRDDALTPPELPVTGSGTATVDALAGGAAGDLLARLEELLEEWGTTPPRVLRTGGLAVRDLRSTTDRLDLPPEHAAFVIELALAAGLVADDGAVVPVWAPTPEADDWVTAPGGVRWARLALAWLGTIRAPHLVGVRAEDLGPTAPRTTGPINALGPDVQWPAVRGLRAEVLGLLADLEPGSATTPEAVNGRLAWQRPLRPGLRTVPAVDAVLAEAEWLGVTGRGALSTAGRTLLATAPDHDAAGTTAHTARAPGSLAEAMAAHLPVPVDHVLLQADLTAIAPGPLEGELAAVMRLASDIESRGGATVHRFSTESVRRALDSGLSSADLLSRLRAGSRTPVPQPLEYLVEDVARRHGRTRVGGGAAYIRSDDVTTLDTMLAARDLAPLQLRRLAPTVLVSAASPALLLEMLRDHGFSPVLEGADGGVVVAKREARRARSTHRAAPARLSALDPESSATLVAELRAAELEADARRHDEATREGPPIPATDPVVTLAILREAMAQGHGVWIGVSDRHGATTRHLVHPQRVDGGRVHALDEQGHPQAWSVHRITGAAVGTD